MTLLNEETVQLIRKDSSPENLAPLQTGELRVPVLTLAKPDEGLSTIFPPHFPTVRAWRCARIASTSSSENSIWGISLCLETIPSNSSVCSSRGA